MTRRLRDESVKAVVLRVDSPGGSAVASEIILNATKRVAAKKPFVVSMGNVAGSGGYYVACGTDTIFADATTITGSIGVVRGKFATTEMWNKVGITLELRSNAVRMPTCWPPKTCLPPTSATLMQNWMDEIYGVFKGHVVAIRGDKLKKDDRSSWPAGVSIAASRLWSWAWSTSWAGWTTRSRMSPRKHN